jgi:sulfide:quinone oxidoreductase
MSSPGPLHVVIAGGGVAALEATMALRDLAGDRVRITIAAPERHFEVKAMRTAEPFSAGHVPHHDLRALADRFAADVRRIALERVDHERHVVRLADGKELAYDALLVAVGAQALPAFRHVLTFGADANTEILNGLLRDLEQSYTRSVAFVVPAGTSWSLPLYELALMTAGEVRSMGIEDVRLELITPEEAPLVLFGPHASSGVGDLLREARIDFRGNAYAQVDRAGHITLMPSGEGVEVARIVALPELYGPAIPGLPSDERGFIPVDQYGQVVGTPDVYAAGDATDFPVKQGGLACQQADAIAALLARRAGADVEPRPFRPVLRGRLLTGRGDRYLRNALHGGAGESQVSDFALWFPPTKVSGHYLSQWLAHADTPPGPSVAVERELSAYELGRAALTLDPLSPVRH